MTLTLYLAFDGVWFTFRGMEIVLLVCFDPETFDVVGAIWSLGEDARAYAALLQKVLKKLGKQPILGVYGDGDKGLVSTLKTYLPLVPFQLCIVHKEMRMGQLVPVKSVNISKRLSEQMKSEILGFQAAFRAVIYAESKPASLAALQLLRAYVEAHPQPRFKQAFRSLQTNFAYTLTHFDHPGMMRDNNLLECFNGILKPRLNLMKGFKKYENLDRYLTLFLLEFRFHSLKESRFAERRDLSPLQIAGVQLPTFYNFLSFLRTSLKLTFTPSEDVI
jgi:transposase-like protein